MLFFVASFAHNCMALGSLWRDFAGSSSEPISPSEVVGTQPAFALWHESSSIAPSASQRHKRGCPPSSPPLHSVDAIPPQVFQQHFPFTLQPQQALFICPRLKTRLGGHDAYDINSRPPLSGVVIRSTSAPQRVCGFFFFVEQNCLTDLLCSTSGRAVIKTGQRNFWTAC